MKKRRTFTPARILLAALAALLLVGSAAAYFLDTLSSESSYAYIGKHREGVGQLGETPVTQLFTVPENGLAAVEVMFSNFNKKPKEGSLTLTLTDAAGKALASRTWPVAELKNNAFITLPLDTPIGDSAGKDYLLSATSDCTDQKGVTLRQGPIDAPAGTLTLADGTVDTENFLNLRVTYTSAVYGWQPAYVLAALALCVLACMPLAGKERYYA